MVPRIETMNEKSDSSPVDSVPDVHLGRGVSGFGSGVKSVFSGGSLLLKNKDLRVNALVPLGITTFLYLCVCTFLIYYRSDLMEKFWQQPEDWKIYLWYGVLALLVVSIFVVLAMVFVPVATMVSGPFYERMVAQILREHEVECREAGLIKGLLFELVRTSVFLGPALGFVILGLIPVIGAPFAMAGIVIGWLGLASTAINPALIMTGHGSGSQIKFVFRSLSVMLGAGMVTGLALTVPLLGLLAVPCSFVGLTTHYAKSIRMKQPL